MLNGTIIAKGTLCLNIWVQSSKFLLAFPRLEKFLDSESPTFFSQNREYNVRPNIKVLYDQVRVMEKTTIIVGLMF